MANLFLDILRPGYRMGDLFAQNLSLSPAQGGEGTEQYVLTKHAT